LNGQNLQQQQQHLEQQHGDDEGEEDGEDNDNDDIKFLQYGYSAEKEGQKSTKTDELLPQVPLEPPKPIDNSKNLRMAGVAESTFNLSEKRKNKVLLSMQQINFIVSNTYTNNNNNSFEYCLKNDEKY